MAQYIATKTPSHPSPQSTPLKPPKATTIHPSILNSTAYGNDEDSVSTLGNHTAKKWSPRQYLSPSPSKPTVPNSITNFDLPTSNDDRSTSSVSTLNTRITAMEGQFQQLSGTMEHIKDMLNLIANPRQQKDGDPKSAGSAGQGNLAGDAP